MQAQHYTDKSIAVFGDTKPWTQNLKELGGRYNPNLRGGHGWIFSKSKEGQVLQFIDDANAGLIAPLPVQPRSPSLAVAYPPQPIRSNQSVQLVRSPVQSIRSPVQMLPSQVTTVSFPNSFVGADNLNYQIIIYTVVLPVVNQLVDIQVGDQMVNYQVMEIEKQNAPFDSIAIAPIDNPNQLSRAVIINGQWKVEGMEQEHSLLFK
jgi:hypothetical protein